MLGDTHQPNQTIEIIMIDKETIEALSQANAITSANADLAQAAYNRGVVALPENFGLVDVEKYMKQPLYFRGTMSTSSLRDFARYVGVNHQPSTTMVFIDPSNMLAKAVMDMGTSDKPGHGAHRAVFKSERTAEFSRMIQVVNNPPSQRDLAEWLEDYSEFVDDITSVDGLSMSTPAAVAAIRSVTIDIINSADNTEGQLSAERSEFESVAARSKRGMLPAIITMRVKPYVDLAYRTFAMRLTISAGERGPRIGLKLIRYETHVQEMGEELCHIVDEKVTSEAAGVKVLIGTVA